MAHFTDGTNDFTADKGLTRAVTPKFHSVVFGDGYEQRAIRGINNFDESYSFNFNNRTSTEANNIISFFESKNGVTLFVFAPPHLGSKTATTSFSGTTITSSGLDTTVLSPSTPSHILITDSTDNDGGYTLDQTSANSATTLTTIASLTTETDTANVVIQAGIAVVCQTWNHNYAYDGFYTVTGTFRRVYEP